MSIIEVQGSSALEFSGILGTQDENKPCCFQQAEWSMEHSYFPGWGRTDTECWVDTEITVMGHHSRFKCSLYWPKFCRSCACQVESTFHWAAVHSRHARTQSQASFFACSRKEKEPSSSEFMVQVLTAWETLTENPGLFHLWRTHTNGAFWAIKGCEAML